MEKCEFLRFQLTMSIKYSFLTNLQCDCLIAIALIAYILARFACWVASRQNTTTHWLVCGLINASNQRRIQTQILPRGGGFSTCTKI